MDSTDLYRNLVNITLGGAPSQPADLTPVPDGVTVVVNEVSAQISRILSSIRMARPKYLSLSGSSQMDDSKKDEFDNTMRGYIREAKHSIDRLEKQERARQDKQNKKSVVNKFFSDPEEDGVSETLHAHRLGMFFNLSLQLEAASSALGELQRVRYARSANQNIKHSRPKNISSKNTEQPSHIPGSLDSVFSSQSSVLQNPLSHFKQLRQQEQQQEVQTYTEASNVDVEEEEEPDSYNEDISESQAQLMQEEHDEIVASLSSSLREAEKAEQSLQQIAILQSELSQHLSTQSLQLESLNSDALRTNKEITGANKYLENAKRSNRFASRCVITASITVGVLLLLANGR